MKKGFIVKVLSLIGFILIINSFIISNKEVQAVSISTISVQEVEDIDNSPYPTLEAIYHSGLDYRNYSQFTINSPGQVTAVLRLAVTAKGNGTAWISRDTDGIDIIETISTFTGSETTISWFLESGTYYFNSIWKDVNFQVNVALMHEASKSGETVVKSDFNFNTSLLIDSATKGFLSSLTPNDYYSFDLPKRANVSIEYSFDDVAYNTAEALGYCTLYNKNRLYVKEGTYSTTDRGTQKMTCILEPGTYYIKLHGLLGNTTLNINPMYTDIILTPEIEKGWTKKTMEVDIETSIDYTEIIVLKQDVAESLIANNDVWTTYSEFNIKLDGETFTALKSGIYSIRITDKYGDYTMKKINITTIDITKPKVTGVENKKAYKKAVTVKWTDKQSGINTSKTTLNGKVVKSGTKISKEGKYTLKVYDKIGNIRTVVFYIDYTPPTSGAENGKTYNSSVTLKFKDSLSGLKKIVVDDMEQALTNTVMRCYLDGEYTVKLWDNAGNYKKIVFYVK